MGFNDLIPGYNWWKEHILGMPGGNATIPTSITPTGGGKAVVNNYAQPPVKPSIKPVPTLKTQSDPNFRFYNYGTSNPSQSATPATNNSGQSNYSDIISLINALGGGSAAYNSKAIEADINAAYKPALDNIAALRAANQKQNAGDIQEVLKIYNALSGDYGKQAAAAGTRYDAAKNTSNDQYAKAVADVNSRYDSQIAALTQQLQQLGQTQTLEGEVNKLNTQRNRVLDNLNQQGNTRASSMSAGKNAIVDYFTTGVTGAKLRGADKASDLKSILEGTLRDLANQQAQTIAARSGDYAKARQSAASAQSDATAQKLNAMFKLQDLMRNDALASAKLNGSTDSYKPADNPYTRANNFFSSLGLGAAGLDRAGKIFQDFMNSNGDLVNGQYGISDGLGGTKLISMTPARAQQIASEYIANKNLNAQEAALLQRAIQNSFK